MHPQLQNSFDSAEDKRSCLLNEVSALNSTDFIKQNGEKWSVAQILTHLMTSEQMSLSYMKKKSLGVEHLSNSGLLEELKMFLLKVSQRVPFKYKAPRLLVENTPAALTLPELINRWDASRAELQLFLDAIEVKNIRKKIYKHPVAGRLDVIQAMEFFGEHIRHHLPQIRRIVR